MNVDAGQFASVYSDGEELALCSDSWSQSRSCEFTPGTITATGDRLMDGAVASRASLNRRSLQYREEDLLNGRTFEGVCTRIDDPRPPAQI